MSIEDINREAVKCLKLLRVRVESSLETENDFLRHRGYFARKRQRDQQKRCALADYGGRSKPPTKGGRLA